MNPLSNSERFKVLGTDKFVRVSLEYQNNQSVRNEIDARLRTLKVPFRVVRDGPSKHSEEIGYMIVDILAEDISDLEFSEELMTKELNEELSEEVPTKEERQEVKKPPVKKATKKKTKKKTTKKYPKSVD